MEINPYLIRASIKEPKASYGELMYKRIQHYFHEVNRCQEMRLAAIDVEDRLRSGSWWGKIKREVQGSLIRKAASEFDRCLTEMENGMEYLR